MKKLVLTGIATIVLAAGALAQGTITLNNAVANNAVADLTAGSYYSGSYGLEVFELSGVTSVPTGINIAPKPGSGLQALNAMLSAGFTKELTFIGQTMSSGTIAQGVQTLPDVTPVGSTVALGLAVWNTGTALSVAEGAAGTHLGVVAFMQATGSPPSPPNPPGPDLSAGWNALGSDLVMTAVPEPGVFALAALGAALLIFRRRS